MRSVDVFYYSLSVGFLILVIFISYASFNIAQTLKKIKMVIEKVDDVAMDVQFVKNKFQVGLLGILLEILKRFAGRGGDKTYERKE